MTVDLNLIEIEPAPLALDGVMMELDDCAFETLGNVVAIKDLNIGMDGINYAALVGAMRKDGMERADLLKSMALFLVLKVKLSMIMLLMM